MDSSGQPAVCAQNTTFEDTLEFLPLRSHAVQIDEPANMPKEHQKKDGAIKYVTSRQDLYIEKTCQSYKMIKKHEDIRTERETCLSGNMENTFQLPRSSPGSVPTTSKKDLFVRGLSLTRKVSRVSKSQNSPAKHKKDISQRISQILDERKLEKRKAESEKHPVDAFLDGIAPTLKSLNPLFLNQAKSRIFAIIQEFEMKQLMTAHGHNMYNPHSMTPFESSSESIVRPIALYPPFFENETGNTETGNNQ